MKSIILIIFSVLSLSSYAQNLIPVEIVLKTNDTLRGKMGIRKNFFDKKFVYSTSFNYKVKFYNKLGEKRKIQAREIQKLTFIDLKGEERIFISKKEFKNHIVELVYQNKISLYKHYYSNTFNGVENFTYNIFNHNGIKYSFDPYGNIKIKLKKLTGNNPEITKFIKENEMNFEDLMTVIKMYEETI